jgi:hypothetical protein
MAQTTMKIDQDLLADLRTLAKDSYRSPQQHLRYLVDKDKGSLRSSNIFDSAMAVEMMDTIVADSEAVVMNEAEQKHIQNLLDSGVELHGSNAQGKLISTSGKVQTQKVQ